MTNHEQVVVIVTPLTGGMHSMNVTWEKEQLTIPLLRILQLVLTILQGHIH